jgi:hypothetical protein
MRAKFIKGKNKNSLHLAREILKVDGIHGLTKGIGAAFVGTSIYGFTYFTSY